MWTAWNQVITTDLLGSEEDQLQIRMFNFYKGERTSDCTETHFLFSLEEFGYAEENGDKEPDLTL